MLTEGSGAVRRDGVETVYLSEPSVETVETAVLCWGCGAASFETVLISCLVPEHTPAQGNARVSACT